MAFFFAMSDALYWKNIGFSNIEYWILKIFSITFTKSSDANLLCDFHWPKGVVYRPPPASFFPAASKSRFLAFWRKVFVFFTVFMYFLWNRTNLQSQEALQSSKSPIVIRRHVFKIFYTATVAIVHRFSASSRENGDYHKQMAA